MAAFPASPDTVATFLAAAAQAGRRPATIARRLGAIRLAHARAGLESPTRAEAVKATLKGIRRTLRVAPVQKTPATVECLAAMLREVPATLAGVRDRAVLLLGFADAFRRSELAVLAVTDLDFRAEGSSSACATARPIRRGRTAGAHSARLEFLPGGGGPCLARGRRALARAAVPALCKGGQLRASRLTAHSIGAIVEAYAAQAGFDPAGFAGHSLRSGFLTSVAERGASLWKLREASRHRFVHPASLCALRRDLAITPGAAFSDRQERCGPRADARADRGSLLSLLRWEERWPQISTSDAQSRTCLAGPRRPARDAAASTRRHLAKAVLPFLRTEL